LTECQELQKNITIVHNEIDNYCSDSCSSITIAGYDLNITDNLIINQNSANIGINLILVNGSNSYVYYNNVTGFRFSGIVASGQSFNYNCIGTSNAYISNNYINAYSSAGQRRCFTNTISPPSDSNIYFINNTCINAGSTRAIRIGSRNGISQYIWNNTITDFAQNGIVSDLGQNNQILDIRDNKISNGVNGISLTNVSNGIITNNIMKNFSSNAMIFTDVINYTIYNNLFNNTNIVTETSSNNNFNTTRQNGTRIYSNGYQIAGNYYTNSMSNGYSDICVDSDKNGFCDNPLSLGSVDYLPLSDEFSFTTTTTTTIPTTTIVTTTTIPVTTTVPSEKSETDNTLIFYGIVIAGLLIAASIYFTKKK
jgi:hypothetical protein